MKNSTLFLSALAAGSLFLFACGRPDDEAPSLQSSANAEQTRIPVLPSSTLAVPPGNELAFHYAGVGVQIYDCKATATGYGWVFRAPSAKLYDKHGRVVAIHYAGPTWESLREEGTVVGSKVAAFTEDPAAVPDLLLQAVSHTGIGPMSRVSYIQRLETRGGIAPAGGCDATTVGESADVDYTATYFFYRPTDEKMEL